MEEVDRQLVLNAVAQLRAARSERERAAVVRHLREQLQVTTATVYRRLRLCGWTSGRKARADKGQSKVSPDQARAVAALVARGRDKKGRPNMPVAAAVEVARTRGVLPEDVSPSTVLRQLNSLHLGPRQMLAPEAGITRVSCYPNHVWQVDVSPCIQWYWRDGAGRKLEQYSDGGARFYPGKASNFPKKKILRYLAVDHYSGAWFSAYYYAEGENAADMVDFLWRAMAPKRYKGFPLRGRPYRIVADQGPAFKSALVQNLLHALDIKFIELHKAGNSKASGSVESRHYKWQRSFENLLSHERAEDLPTINWWAEATTALYSGSRKHARHGRPPLEIWCRIRPEQLREVPERDIFFQLASSAARTATLTNKLWIRADGRTWQVRSEAAWPGQKVLIRRSPFWPEGLRAWTTEGIELGVTEVQFNEVGFPVSGAHFHVWDDEEHKGAKAPMTAGQELAAHVAAGTRLPPALGDIFGDLVAEAARQHYLDVASTPWTGTDSPLAVAPLLSRVIALERATELLGRWLTDAEATHLTDAIGDGCTEADLEGLLAELVAPTLSLAQEG